MIRLYALLLLLYPPSFRRAHGREILQFLREAGPSSGLLHRAGLAADLGRSLLREWYDELRPRGTHRNTFVRPRRGAVMRSPIRDVRFAARSLVRSPGVTAAAVLTLALGIGANTAIFSLADATLLRPLDVAEPDRLVSFTWSSSYPDYKIFTELRDVFTGTIAGGGGSRVSLAVDDAADLVPATFVSGNAFEVLGVTPAAGRLLQPADDVPNGEVVGVLSYNLWKTRFGGRSDVIGRTLHVNGRAVTIVGVIRQGFRGTSLSSNPGLFMPISAVPRVSTGFFERAPVLTSSNFVWLNVIGRLQPGVTIAQASSAVDARYRQVHPPARGDRPVQALQLEPLNTRALGGSAASLRRFVLLLGGVVALTLLIGCANLANLLLARAAGRRREIGIRVALGAGRAGIVRQTLAESLLLAAIGGVAGLLVASLGLRVLSAYQLPGGVLIDILDLGFSLPALAATAGLSIVCGLLFGVVPAWQAARTDVMGSLRHDARVGSARGGMRAVFVAAQVALSLVLLTGSGLFLRSLVHAVNAPLGFEAGGVSVVSVNPGLARYDRARAATFYAEALARVRSMPQVEAAAWASVIPTSGVMMLEMSEIEGYHPQEDGGMTFHASPVGPEYFAAVGTRILAGRPFTDQDAAAPAPVVIVNEAAARKYWSGDAVGRRVKIGSKGGWATVVGVSENAKIREISERPQPMVYWPFEQAGDWELAPETAHLFVRSADASGILPLVAGQLRAADAAVPISSVRTLDEIVRGLVMPQRMGAVLFGCFSAVGLLLAAIGIYGVAAYVATQRTREFGIRMALGATRREIGRLMLTHGGRPVAAGLAAGLVLAAWTAGLATAFLHDVSPRDPVTFVAVAAILALVALAAGYLPARRAGRTDPVVALRHE